MNTTDTTPPSALVHLTTAGVSLLLDATDARLPAVVYWGSALGSLTSEDARALSDALVEPASGNVVDQPVRLALLPELHAGWEGKPGVAGHRDGTDWSPKFAVTSIEFTTEPHREGILSEAGAAAVTFRAGDGHAGLSLTIEVELLVSGLLRARAELTNTAAGTYTVTDLNVALPVPSRASEILDFAGRWSRERTPQRRQLVVGIHEREGRKGRTGPDAATILSVGTPGFGFQHGEVWGVHVAFSGNHRHYAERLSTGFQVVGGGELLLPGEIRLQPDESYRGPWLYGAYGSGLDDQAHRFHRYLRSRAEHPASERRVTLNVWEAVYFDHDCARLIDLADRAAAMGVERYVLDDGWFSGRRDDTRGLGDWSVDTDVWPTGLAPIVDQVRGLGMEFGLWFEPEMINEDSDLARAHPEWIMQTGGRLPVESRHQQVLNLGIPAAYDHIVERMSSILSEYDITYIKWDHNRDLIDAGTYPSGAPGVHEQTLAAYRLMDDLKRRHPGLEIESCASGGSRVDLGVIERTDRVWVSDCLDSVDRQQMNRWTMQLLPAEMLGSHIGSGVNHTTGRRHELSFRAATALFGHFGIEWDLTQATQQESLDLAAWIELYKKHRSLLHTGDLMRADQTDPTLQVYGAVSPDKREALIFLAYLGRSDVAPRRVFTVPGLAPDKRYRVAPVLVGTPDDGHTDPLWYGDGSGVVLTGRVLAAAGLQAPGSFPERIVMLRVTEEC
ncbi:alpha-galactosidase [Subtercola vilae]|uniref:Alpha-galactosidase n=1 Tax=Subtercola vilae TaxID=2056433 RepID=A0A4T2CCM1_9MICO|nr:alpha-galactosidase [Subtercola vilae]TIH40406.1 alpha-galactosidase [Subtercola vilae]